MGGTPENSARRRHDERPMQRGSASFRTPIAATDGKVERRPQTARGTDEKTVALPALGGSGVKIEIVHWRSCGQRIPQQQRPGKVHEMILKFGGE
jgi:hypothetical protein